MPYSAGECRPWMLDKMRKLNPASMLDVGVGAGIYGILFGDHFPGAQRIGVEIWEPYVWRFCLRDIYHRLIVGDIRTLAPWPAVDVVIFGDVIEHMAQDEARKVWATAREVAGKAVYLAIPIVHYPQGPWAGNPHEAHVVDDYSHERVLETFEGIGDWQLGNEVGAYEALT